MNFKLIFYAITGKLKLYSFQPKSIAQARVYVMSYSEEAARKAISEKMKTKDSWWDMPDIRGLLEKDDRFDGYKVDLHDLNDVVFDTLT